MHKYKLNSWNIKFNKMGSGMPRVRRRLLLKSSAVVVLKGQFRGKEYVDN